MRAIRGGVLAPQAGVEFNGQVHLRCQQANQQKKDRAPLGDTSHQQLLARTVRRRSVFVKRSAGIWRSVVCPSTEA
jgi:hypothetical protein